jgi:hypothetical protein
MKTRTNPKPGYFSLFPIRFFSPEWAMFLLIIFVHFITGCQTYYKVKPGSGSPESIAQMQKDNKYFILHEGDNAWHLKDLVLNEDELVITGIIETLPDSHQYYKKTNPEYANRYKPAKGNPTYEVHFYIKEHIEQDNNQVTVPLLAIEKIEVYDKAAGATAASYAFGALGIILGILAIVAIIAVLTKSSCPFVYISDGQTYRFAGEIYGGAIYSCLERDDYMPLPGFKPVKGEYQLKISNELLERQFTNLAELSVVEHPLQSTVLIDKYGKLQTMTNPVAPETAISDIKADCRETLLKRDHKAYLFNDNPKVNNDMSSLTLTFPRQPGARVGKLVLNTQNSLWLDYVYGKFNEQFGTYYNTFAEDQKEVPAEHHHQWAQEQGVSMSAYLETEDGWEYIDYFDLIGPLATRDVVMPVDLTHAKGDKVRIKLTCGYMFWEIDYAAMDFSENIPAQTTTLSAFAAFDENGVDVSQLVQFADDRYLVQPKPGNEAIFTYAAPAIMPAKEYTAFLHTRGYYEYIRDYQNKPNLGYLKTFKDREGAFTKFSKLRYADVMKEQAAITSKSSQSHGK